MQKISLRASCIFIALLLIKVVKSQLPTDSIILKLQQYGTYHPIEKLYVSTNAQIYTAGEDIFFSTYLVHGDTNFFDSVSRVVYVELYSNNQQLLSRNIIYSAGIGQGYISLPDTLPQGIYLLRAYTNYMKNHGPAFYFYKRISVLGQKRSATNSKEIDSKLDLQFLPEGGSLLLSQRNTIAFKATGAGNQPISIKGHILDPLGKRVDSFSATFQGMGSFTFTPVQKEGYKAIVVEPAKYAGKYALPTAEENSYILNVTDEGDHFKVTAISNRQCSGNNCTVKFVATCRTNPVMLASGILKDGKAGFSLEKKYLPSGVTQITLFNETDIPVSERMIFVNHKEQLRINFSIKSDTLKSRASTEIKVAATSPDNVRHNGFFNLSVIAANRVVDSFFLQENIHNYLLLGSEIKGDLVNPGYYFSDTTETIFNHADLLMLTQGWRKLLWADIVNNNYQKPVYLPEPGLVVSGFVTEKKGKPFANKPLNVFTANGNFFSVSTDTSGKFYINTLFHYDSTTVVIDPQKENLHLEMNALEPALTHKYKYVSREDKDTILQQQLLKDVETVLQYQDFINSQTLSEVVVKSNKKATDSYNKIYKNADVTLAMKDVPPGFNNVFDVLQGRLAGVLVQGDVVSIRGGGPPFYLYDGMPVEKSFIQSINPSQIDHIDVFKGASAAIFGASGGSGVIAIYSKQALGNSQVETTNKQVFEQKIPGFQVPKLFYQPVYGNDVAATTIFNSSVLSWIPVFRSAEQSTFSFYTSDKKGLFYIIAEGLSDEGVPGFGVKSFYVK